MKPKLRTQKPALRAKRPVSTNALLFRATRYFDQRDQMLIRRKARALGPLFVLDLATGVVVERRIPSLAALAKRHALLKPWEVLA